MATPFGASPLPPAARFVVGWAQAKTALGKGLADGTLLPMRPSHLALFALGAILFGTLFVSQPASALPMENPNGVGDLADQFGCQGNGTGSNAGCGIPIPSFVLNQAITHIATGTFSCFTFGCHDRADAFFIEVPVGFVIRNVRAEALVNDAERFEIVGIFDLTAFNTFDYTPDIGPGTYLVEVENGIQKNGGVFTGFGSAGGAWRMEFLVEVGVAVPEPTVPMLLCGTFAIAWLGRRRTGPSV